MKKYFIFLGLALLGLMSCKKNAFVSPGEEAQGPRITGINLIFNGPPVDFYNNSFRISPATGVTAISKFPGIGYATTTAGSTKIEVKVYNPPTAPPVPTTPSAGTSLASMNINLEDAKYYSAVVFGESVTSPELLIVEDKIPAVQAGKGFIRVLHTLSNGPAVKLDMTNTSVTPTVTSTPITGVNYKSFSDFMTVENGGYSFQIKDAQTGAAIGAIFTLNINEGRTYTIFVSGVMGATPATTVISSGIYQAR